VDCATSSCISLRLYGVPLYDHVGQRELMDGWAAKKGEEGVARYWQDKNLLSLDGRPTGL
jgi:hypothetical protein